jgi:uncharacterized membrane protein
MRIGRARGSVGDMRDHVRTLTRWALAVLMLVAGVGHLAATDEFLGQTPTWLPFREALVWISGPIEIALAVALVAWPGRRREVGWALATFFVLVFPGNVHQALNGTDTFGLDTDAERWVRLVFQPLLIVAALWATGTRLTRRRGPGGSAGWGTPPG